MSDGGGSRFVYVIGLHADQFRNKVYSYGAKLFFTRHKPDNLYKSRSGSSKGLSSGGVRNTIAMQSQVI